MKLPALLLVLVACGQPPHARSTEATKDRPASHEAADRARAEAAASGEAPVSSEGKHWGGWRYTGDRGDCFYVVGRRCFTDQREACAAAKCASKRCRLDGAGPARVSCAK